MRRTYSSLYKADPSFVRELRLIDRYLDVRWSPHQERWIILRIAPRTGEEIFIFRVENEDGSYRGLDGRVFKRLRASDMFRRSGDARHAALSLCREMDKMEKDHHASVMAERAHKQKWIRKDHKKGFDQMVENLRSGVAPFEKRKGSIAC